MDAKNKTGLRIYLNNTYLKGVKYESIGRGYIIFFSALVAVISWYLTKNENLDSNSGYFLGGRI